MNDWEEEVEIVFEDFQKGFVTEQELREQLDEWGGSLIPEEEYEEVLMKMEQLFVNHHGPHHMNSQHLMLVLILLTTL